MREPVAREGGCAIAVMAKAPRPGQVKTRLIPPLTAGSAAALSASFLRDITENITLAARRTAIQGYVAYAPVGLERAFDGLLSDGTRLIPADGGNLSLTGVQGFGCSLLHAAQALFAQQRPAGPYTAEQAAAGRAAYQANCASCHAANMRPNQRIVWSNRSD